MGCKIGNHCSSIMCIRSRKVLEIYLLEITLNVAAFAGLEVQMLTFAFPLPTLVDKVDKKRSTYLGFGSPNGELTLTFQGEASPPTCTSAIPVCMLKPILICPDLKLFCHKY